jgi:hypothetical protein
MSLRGRTIAFYAAMWSLMLLACGLAALAYFGYQGSKFPRLPMAMSGDWLMARDDEMGFVPTPNGATEIRNIDTNYRFHIFTDRRSARVNTPGEQTGDSVDVMALGCSFTWGAGIESDQTYIQQLGRSLGVSVANFAMGSFGSVQAFLMLLRNADLRPKVIVYGFIQDHLRRNVAPCAPNYVPYCAPVAYLQRDGDRIVLRPPHMELFSPEDNRAFMAEVAMHDRAGPTAFFLRTKWAAKIAWLGLRNRTVSVDQSPETAALALTAMIHALAEEAQKIGAELVVLNLPYLVRGRVGPVPPALTAAVAGLRLTFVDFGPVAATYYEQHPTGMLTLGDDPHPNPTAHRMIAETLAAPVRTLLGERDSEPGRAEPSP